MQSWALSKMTNITNTGTNVYYGLVKKETNEVIIARRSDDFSVYELEHFHICRFSPACFSKEQTKRLEAGKGVVKPFHFEGGFAKVPDKMIFESGICTKDDLKVE